MASPPCANNCGFFGSPENDNLCPNCFQRQAIPVTPQRASILFSIPVMDGPFCASSHDTSVPIIFTRSSPPASDGRPDASTSVVANIISVNSPTPSAVAPGETRISEAAKAKPTRCQNCQKKVGLTGIRCRCGLVLCSFHRFPDQHSCSFNFKARDRETLAKANPTIEAPKIYKI